MSSSLKEFQEKDFSEFQKNKQNALVLFSAPWCASCKIVTSIIEKLSQSFKDLEFIKIDVSKSPGLASRMGVMSLPNILIFKKGKVIEQAIGTISEKELEGKLKKI